jgi:uncharacterized protein (UPF0276 family)
MEGVGVSYHPFLHETILTRREAFDFIELPLDLYADPAWSALLDPHDARLAEIAAAKPCCWRGSTLSLGSVERIGDPAHDAGLIARIRDLMATTRATFCCEAIGFRRLGKLDLGRPQSLPFTETAARWIAARYAAACDGLGYPVLLQLRAATNPTPRRDWNAANFLCRIADIADCRLVLDVADIARLAADAGLDAGDLANGMPVERVAVLVTSGEREEDWALLSTMLALSAARAVVIQAGRNIFPVARIIDAARRAADALADRERRPPAPARPSEPPGRDDPAELSALRAWQSEWVAYCSDPSSPSVPASLTDVAEPARAALAVAAQSWQNWRAQVGDMHKAQEIMRFLAQDAAYSGWQGG